jgi:hypothetical protein
MNNKITWALLLGSTVVLAACKEKPEPPPPPPPPPAATYTVGGTVTGLTSQGLVLAVNGTNLTVASGASSFVSSGSFASGTAYTVTQGTKPATQTCTVTNGTGTVGSANVSNVAVNCVTDTFSVAATVSGLTGTGLMLQLNGGTGMSVTGNGVQTFVNRVDAGTAYAVTVQTQPSTPTQQCTVTNGSGNNLTADITNVAVACTTTVYNVSGTVSGLTGTLGLSVTTSGGLPAQAITLQPSATSFALPTTLSSGVAFRVSVATQPAGQTCLVTRGIGVMASSNVSGIAVTCAGNLTSPLVGTYAITLADAYAVIAFSADGTYTLVVRGIDDGCISNNNLPYSGIEYGTYTWNSTTGLFRVLNAPLDTTGRCGFFDPRSTDVLGDTLTKSGNTLTFVSNNPSDPHTVTFTAVPSVTNTLVGSFTPFNGVALTFLNDGTFITASTQDRPTGVVDTGTQAGIEHGCYTSTGSDYMLDFSGACLPTGRAALDNSGNNGLALNGQARTGSFTVVGDTLTTATPALTASRIVVNTLPPPPPSPPAGTYTVGGTITGLNTNGLVLLLNNGNNLVIPAGATTFTFPNALATGTAYGVATLTPPPTQRCSMTNGSGTIASANVTNVTLACNTQGAFSLGGTVSGLTGTLGLTATLGAGLQPVTINVQPGATTFALPNPITAFTGFRFTVSSQPAGQTCIVSRGAGGTAAAAITDVRVTCAAKTPSILVGAYDNGGLTFYADGSYVQVNSDPTSGCSGIEYGIYSWNSATGAFRSVIAPVDTNGDCGLRDSTTPNVDRNFTLTKTGNSIRLQNTDPTDPTDSTKLALPSVANTLIGSFEFYVPGFGAYVAFLSDGTFVSVATQDRPTGSNNNGVFAGYERGCYSTAGGVLTVDMSATCRPDGRAVVDTSGNNGYSLNGQSRSFDFAISGDTLVTGTPPFTTLAMRTNVN